MVPSAHRGKSHVDYFMSHRPLVLQLRGTGMLANGDCRPGRPAVGNRVYDSCFGKRGADLNHGPGDQKTAVINRCGGRCRTNRIQQGAVRQVQITRDEGHLDRGVSDFQQDRVRRVCRTAPGADTDGTECDGPAAA
jgi:hypothetical protein